jgi:MFS family permease
MTRSTAKKLGLLATLYFAQGLPYGFFTQALPALLRELGLSLPAIGLSSLLAIPWALKFVWAPAVDRVGTRRRWILGLQAAAAVIALAMATLHLDASLTPLLVGVLLLNLVAATQDIATDGLAISLLQRHERGLGNGIQVAGYRVGMIVGGGVLLVAFDRVGWAVVLLCMAGLIALSSIPVALSQDVERPPQGSGPSGWDWVRLPGATGWLVVLGVYKFGDYLAGGMLRPFLIDRGMTLTELGTMLGAVGFTAGLVGALVGGALVEVVGRRRALVGFGTLQALGIAGYATVAALELSRTAVWVAATFEHFVGGMAVAALFTLMMDASREEQAATDYTLQASTVVIATGAAAAVSGFGAEWFGYDGLFALAAILAFAGVALATSSHLTRITRRET